MKIYIKNNQHFFTKSNNMYDFYIQGDVIYNASSTMLEIARKNPVFFDIYNDEDQIIIEKPINYSSENNKQIIYQDITKQLPIAFDVLDPDNIKCQGICIYQTNIAKAFNNQIFFYTNPNNKLYNNIITSLDNIKIFVIFNLLTNIVKNKSIINIYVVYDLISMRKDHEEYNVYASNIRYNIESNIKSQDYLIAISEPIKQELIERYNISKDKIFVIQPGIDLNIYKKVLTKTDFDTLKIPDEYILCSGITSNINSNISKLTFLPIIDFGIINMSFQNLMTEYNYKTIGYVKEQTKIDLYSNAKQFLTTRSYEGFDIQPFEQLQCHTKVLQSHSNVHDYFLPQFDNVIFYEDHNMEEIKEFINKPISFEHDDKLLKEFVWDNQISKMKGVLKMILKTTNFKKQQLMDINVLTHEQHYGGIAYYIRDIQTKLNGLVDFITFPGNIPVNYLSNVSMNYSDDFLKQYKIYFNTSLFMDNQLLQKLKNLNIKIQTVVYDLMMFHEGHEAYIMFCDKMRELYKQTLFQANIIIAISQSIKNEIHERFNISLDKIIVAYPGVDLDVFKSTTNIKENYILTNYAPMGVDFLKQLNIPVNQSGFIQPSHAHYMKENLGNLYNLIGFVDRNKLIDLYSNAKQFFSAQQYEGFDMQPIEQLQCHTKVIQSHSNVHDEILTEFDNVIFYEDHTIQEVKEFLDKPTSFEHDIEIIKEKYNWDKSQEKIFDILTVI